MKKEKFYNHPVEEYTTRPPMEGPLNTTGLIKTDPMGSYTGLPIDKWEQPVQDADDL